MFSCARIDVHAYEAAPAPEEASILDEEAVRDLPVNKQLSMAVRQGLLLDFDAFEFVVPATAEGKENRIALDGARAGLRLNSPSIHGLDFYLEAPLNYNGAKKDIDLTLQEDELYFSLTDDSCDYASGNGGFRFNTTLYSSDEHAGECDEATRGICYFEYGSLDYFLYSVFESFGLDSFSLSSGESNESAASVDLASIFDATNEIREINAHYFVLDLPLGDGTLSFGLSSNGDNVLNRIDFPYGESEHEFNNGMKLSFSAAIEAKTYAKALPFEENTYLRLEDSLSLVKRIGNLVSDKTFGIEGSIAVSHIEDEVIGDDSHFQRDAISETGVLSVLADVDLTSSYHDINASLEFTSDGNTESARVHIDDEKEKPECYFDINGVLKGYSTVSVFSSLFSTLSNISDEDIQNDSIMRLLSGLLATSDSITEAINGIKSSAVYEAVGEGHYEGILNALRDYGHEDDRIHFTLDLAYAGGHGTIGAVLDANDASLLSLTLDEAGIVTSNSPKLSLLMSGSLEIRDYELEAFDKQGYEEFKHLPSLESSIRKFTDTDQLAVSLEGYMIKRGTTASASYSVPSWNGTSTLSQQGFNFSGSLGFDLKAKTGTGSIDFTDRKEKYYNGHHLKIDVTGPAETAGNMLFQYSSDGADNGPLKGRIAITSMNEILDIATEFLTSTDPRFKRITNLFNSIMTESTIGAIVSGKYLGAIAKGFLSSSTINTTSNVAILEFKPGLIKEGHGLKVRLTFDGDYVQDGETLPGKIKTLEILSESSSANEGTDIYAKITFVSADFAEKAPSYNWMGGSYSNSDFTDYSSLSDLLQAVLNTFTLGVDEENEQYESTYHITGKISLSVLSKINFDVNLDFYVSVDGTYVKLIGSLDLPIFKALNSKNSSGSTAGTIWNGITTVLGSGDEEGHRYVALYYYASGNDADNGMMLINRFDKYHGKDGSWLIEGSDDSWHEFKVLLTGKEFGSDLLGYLLKDVFGFNDWIMGQIGSTESSSSSALHGEDIVKSFTYTSSSTSPKWNLTLGIDELANTSLLGDAKLQLSAMNIGNGEFALSGVSTTEDLKILTVVTASLSVNIANISSKGYTACFDNSISIADRGISSSKSYTYWGKKRYVTRYTLGYATGTARNLYSSRFISNETVNSDGSVTYTYGTKASGLRPVNGSSNLY